jgi:hypothetical protein
VTVALTAVSGRPQVEAGLVLGAAPGAGACCWTYSVQERPSHHRSRPATCESGYQPGGVVRSDMEPPSHVSAGVHHRAGGGGKRPAGGDRTFRPQVPGVPASAPGARAFCPQVLGPSALWSPGRPAGGPALRRRRRLVVWPPPVGRRPPVAGPRPLSLPLGPCLPRGAGRGFLCGVRRRPRFRRSRRPVPGLGVGLLPSPVSPYNFSWALRDSNPRPARCKRAALTT